MPRNFSSCWFILRQSVLATSDFDISFISHL